MTSLSVAVVEGNDAHNDVIQVEKSTFTAKLTTPGGEVLMFPGGVGLRTLIETLTEINDSIVAEYNPIDR